ncbi:MAG: Asp-tRNA(Asn)/Glu-tRNA(Gln) amidotransferase subunit GatC [Candidatus Aenigmatarchaeota archaeon]
MTKLDEKTLEHVAANARLELSEKEFVQMQKDLSGIMDAFKIIDKASPRCEPTFQPVSVRNVVREDVLEETYPQAKALQNTKHSEKGFFKGPKAV